MSTRHSAWGFHRSNISPFTSSNRIFWQRRSKIIRGNSLARVALIGAPRHSDVQPKGNDYLAEQNVELTDDPVDLLLLPYKLRYAY